jgi:hypothetical protein
MKCFSCEKNIAGLGTVKKRDGKLYCKECYNKITYVEPVVEEPELEAEEESDEDTYVSGW